jgi:hypothetical protein
MTRIVEKDEIIERDGTRGGFSIPSFRKLPKIAESERREFTADGRGLKQKTHHGDTEARRKPEGITRIAESAKVEVERDCQN